jgi:hypothetical protein
MKRLDYREIAEALTGDRLTAELRLLMLFRSEPEDDVLVEPLPTVEVASAA